MNSNTGTVSSIIAPYGASYKGGEMGSQIWQLHNTTIKIQKIIYNPSHYVLPRIKSTSNS